MIRRDRIHLLLTVRAMSDDEDNPKYQVAVREIQNFRGLRNCECALSLSETDGIWTLE